MMHTGKQYDVRTAMVTACVAMAKGEAMNLKTLLREAGVPEECAELAAKEMLPIVFSGSQMARLFLSVAESEEKAMEMVNDLFSEATWIDDDKGETKISVFVEGEEGLPDKPTVEVITRKA